MRISFSTLLYGVLAVIFLSLGTSCTSQSSMTSTDSSQTVAQAPQTTTDNDREFMNTLFSEYIDMLDTAEYITEVSKEDEIVLFAEENIKTNIYKLRNIQTIYYGLYAEDPAPKELEDNLYNQVEKVSDSVESTKVYLNGLLAKQLKLNDIFWLHENAATDKKLTSLIEILNTPFLDKTQEVARTWFEKHKISDQLFYL